MDHIVINTSGCGTTVKDYGFMFREDKLLAADAKRVSEATCDISELMSELGLQPTGQVPRLKVAYHSACSMQHGQKITRAPFALLEAAGFDPVGVPESHICCGSAGTYNILQPEIADQLKARKVRNIESVEPQLIAAGNLGCMIQIGGGTALPMVHTVELLDWATGGPVPKAIEHLAEEPMLVAEQPLPQAAE